MRFGYCAHMKDADIVARAGFDYIECPAAAMSEMSDDEFAAGVQKLRDAGLNCETTNLFLPKPIQIYETDRAVVREYFDRTFERLARLGVKVAVFGSGGARKVPKDMTMADAESRFIDFTRFAAETALPYGFTLALEPLNFRETNFMLTEDEGYALVKQIDLPNVKLLLDLFHFSFEVKPMDAIDAYKDALCHIHIAEPFSRKIPRAGHYDYAPLFAALKNIGYTGRVSVEAGPISEDALREALAVLHAAERDA